MSLSSDPSRGDIYGELTTLGSNYSGANSLKEMYSYVFGGDGSGYSRDDLGGYGIPELPTDALATSNIDTNSVDLTTTVNDYGNLQCTFVARYTTETTVQNPTWTYSTLGTASSGSPTFTLSGLSDSTTYAIEVGIYNKFNNLGNSSYVYTEREEITTEASKYSTPNITTAEIVNGSNEAYVALSADGNQDSIEFEHEINGVDQGQASVQCSNGAGSTSPEAVITLDAFIQSGDTIRVRARSNGSQFNPSDWTGWFTVSHVSSTKTCIDL